MNSAVIMLSIVYMHFRVFYPYFAHTIQIVTNALWITKIALIWNYFIVINIQKCKKCLIWLKTTTSGSLPVKIPAKNITGSDDICSEKMWVISYLIKTCFRLLPVETEVTKSSVGKFQRESWGSFLWFDHGLYP